MLNNDSARQLVTKHLAAVPGGHGLEQSHVDVIDPRDELRAGRVGNELHAPITHQPYAAARVQAPVMVPVRRIARVTRLVQTRSRVDARDALANTKEAVAGAEPKAIVA